MQFDEVVHLVTLGGGFLRTPYLTATQDAVNYGASDVCSALSPQITHIPAAGRRSGLNLESPTYAKTVFTSALCKRLTTDAAAQINQESAAITFGFHESPERNIARIRLSEGLRDITGRLMVAERAVAVARPIDLNTVPSASMSTGFLAFISRYWQDLRHVDTNMLMRYQVPLQFDGDFDIIPMINNDFVAHLPIIGNHGPVIAFDSRLGPDAYSPSGSSIGGVGTVRVVDDGIGGYYLRLEIDASAPALFPIAIMDAQGQVFSRNLVVQDGYPTGAVVKCPHGMVGVPYVFKLPCCEDQPDACGVMGSFRPEDLVLPAGLTYNRRTDTIEGTPSEYGSNFGLPPTMVTQAGEQFLGLSLTINRPHRKILEIVDTVGNDYATGEFYASAFMPFGSILTYGGHTFEFRRHLSNLEPWPGIREIPYTYGAASRQSARSQEIVWRATA